MARPKPRSNRPEEIRVRQRIRYELATTPGLTHRKLVALLKDAGQPVSSSWVSKVLAHDKAQHMTVNELGALVAVLGIEPSDVFGDRDEALNKEANDLLRELSAVRDALKRDVVRLEDAIGRARSLVELGEERAFYATDVVSRYERALETLTDLYLEAVEDVYSIDGDVQHR